MTPTTDFGLSMFQLRETADWDIFRARGKRRGFRSGAAARHSQHARVYIDVFWKTNVNLQKNLAQSPRCRRKLRQIFNRLTQSTLHELNKGQVNWRGGRKIVSNFLPFTQLFIEKTNKEKKEKTKRLHDTLTCSPPLTNLLLFAFIYIHTLASFPRAQKLRSSCSEKVGGVVVEGMIT